MGLVVAAVTGRSKAVESADILSIGLQFRLQDRDATKWQPLSYEQYDKRMGVRHTRFKGTFVVCGCPPSRGGRWTIFIQQRYRFVLDSLITLQGRHDLAKDA